ncbi:hypothetical protein Q7P36_007145 [Cladosporium allicinum]
MATQRRTNIPEKTVLSHAEIKAEPKSNIAPAVPSSIIFKLLAFTFAMITFPIGSYFLSVNMLFGASRSFPLIPSKLTLEKEHEGLATAPNPSPPGNSTYAGATAAIVANIVLIAYVVVAFQDDKSEREADIASGVISPPSEGRKEK